MVHYTIIRNPRNSIGIIKAPVLCDIMLGFLAEASHSLTCGWRHNVRACDCNQKQERQWDDQQHTTSRAISEGLQMRVFSFESKVYFKRTCWGLVFALT